MKRAALNDTALHRPVAASGSCAAGLFFTRTYSHIETTEYYNQCIGNFTAGYVSMLYPSCFDSHIHTHYLEGRLCLPVRVDNCLIPCVAMYLSLLSPCKSDLWTLSLLERIAETSTSTQSNARNQISLKVNSLETLFNDMAFSWERV